MIRMGLLVRTERVLKRFGRILLSGFNSIHFPNEQAALKSVYLAIRALDPTGKGRARWVIRSKPALNAFSIAFEGRRN